MHSKNLNFECFLGIGIPHRLTTFHIGVEHSSKRMMSMIKADTINGGMKQKGSIKESKKVVSS